MTTIISGDSPSVTFSDSTTQTTSAIVGGKVPYANLPAGSMLQVVSASNPSVSLGVSTISTTAIPSGISVSIVPKFANSLIKVDFVSDMAVGTVSSSLVAQMFVNGANIGGLYSAGYMSAGVYAPIVSSFYLTPATTTSQTYQIYFYSSGGNQVYLVHPSGSYSLTATEIAQ